MSCCLKAVLDFVVLCCVYNDENNTDDCDNRTTTTAAAATTIKNQCMTPPQRTNTLDVQDIRKDLGAAAG